MLQYNSFQMLVHCDMSDIRLTVHEPRGSGEGDLYGPAAEL